jgi:hypothetical protein
VPNFAVPAALFAGVLIALGCPDDRRPLPDQEVLCSVSSGNKKVAICSGFVFQKEPSEAPATLAPVTGRSRRRRATVSTRYLGAL